METELIISEAEKILELAKSQNLLLRLMGACAIKLHSPDYGQLYGKMGRSLSDLDFASFSKESEKIERIMTHLGYEQDRRIVAFHELQRNFFFNNNSRIKADVFYDKLSMCHTIDFKGRLELDYPTITLSDILLEKMQIVRITEKDLKDSVILLLGHEIAESDGDTINPKYISKLLANDWGFYYTFTLNSNKVKEYANKLTQVLSESERQNLSSKVDSLRKRIEEEPKSFKWKMRARVGPSVKWYDEVEDLVRTQGP